MFFLGKLILGISWLNEEIKTWNFCLLVFHCSLEFPDPVSVFSWLCFRSSWLWWRHFLSTPHDKCPKTPPFCFAVTDRTQRWCFQFLTDVIYLNFNCVNVNGPNDKIMTKISPSENATVFNGHFCLPVQSRSPQDGGDEKLPNCIYSRGQIRRKV